MGKELQKVLRNLREVRTSSERILKTALVSVQSEMVERIHTQGKDSKGSSIGQYSTNPISISKKNQARNTGKTFFKGGYKEYKNKIGFSGSKVNLENTGQMRQDFSIIDISITALGLGFKNQLNADKSDWMEDKYDKKIYSPTKKENETAIKVIEFEINRILRR